MSKKKIPDYTLVNSFESDNNRAKLLFSPKVDVDSYLNVMNNPPFEEAPNDFNWFSNAYYDWSYNKNKVDADTELGDYIMANEDYDTLLRVKDYINATQELSTVYKLLQQNPNDQELLTKYTDLLNIKNSNEESYNKALLGDLNTKYVADDMRFRLQQWERTGNPSNAMATINLETSLYLKPGLEEPESSSSDNNIYNRRIVSLKNALRYSERAAEFQNKMESEYYKRMKDTPGMDLTNVDTYLYKLPGLLGSSASSIGRLLIGTAGAMYASGKGGGPIGAAAGALLSIGANVSSRDRESKAEVYQNYKMAIQNAADKLKISKKVIEQAQELMVQSGKYSPEQIKDTDFVYDLILSNNISVDNVRFNRLMLDNLEGLRSLYTDNMALSGSDVVQQAIEVTPIGSMAKAVKGLKPLLKVLATKAISKGSETLSGLRGLLSLRIDDITAFGIDNVDKLPKLTTRKAVVDLGGRILVSSALEGAEEGIQYIKGQRYIDRDFDPDPSLVKSFVRNLGTGARSIFAAITPWDPVYSNDLEFLENFKGGALLGGIMTGAIGSATTYNQVNRLLPADKFVASLYAEKMDTTDRVRKDVEYGRMLRENRWSEVMSAFDTLEDAGIQGVSAEDIKAERKRAELIRNMFTSNYVMGLALSVGIDPRTLDYDIFVALKDHHDLLLADAVANNNEISNEVLTTIYSPEVEQHIDNILPKGSVEDKAFLRQSILNKVRLEEYKRLIEDYKNQGKKLSELEKNTKILTSKSDVFTFEHLLNKDLATYESSHSAMLDKLKALGITEELLEVPKLHLTLKDIVEKEIITSLDRARAELELAIMNSTDRKAILAKINRWKQVQELDDDFVLKLDDLYSGKTEETAIEDAEEITPGELFEAPPVEEPSIAELLEDQLNEEELQAEDPDVAAQREKALQNIKEFFTTERDGRGDSHNVLDTKNVFGLAYKSASSVLENLYRQINPKTKKYADYVAANRLQSSNDSRADTWEDLYNLRNQLEEEVYTNGASETSYSLIEQIKNKIAEIDSLDKQEDQANELLLKIKEKEKEVNTKIDDTTPKETTETVDPTKLPEVEEVPKVQDLPTLGEILGGLVGEEAISKIDSPTDTIHTEDVTEDRKKLRGYKQLRKGLRDLLNASTPIEKLNAVGWIQSNVYHGAVVTAEEQRMIDAAVLDAAEEGYEITPMLGKRYHEGMKVWATFITDENAEPGSQIITAIRKPLIDKDGKMVLSADIVVTQGIPLEYLDEPNDSKTSIVLPLLTYDLQLDPYSHELNYRLTDSKEGLDGKWIRIPKKYQGMELYLNNDEFSEVAGNPDFVLETTKNGIRIEVRPYNNGKTIEDAIYAIFNYKGKEYIAAVKTIDRGLRARSNTKFNRLPFDQQQYITNNLIQLRNKILELSRVAAQDSNLLVVPTIIRTTTGSIVNERDLNGRPINRLLTDSAWLTVKDPYKINPSNTEIGITTGPRGGNVIRLGTRIVSVKENYPMGKPIWIFKAKKYDGTYEDKKGLLNYKYFKDSPKVADLIIDLILNKDQFYTDATGLTTNIRPLELLKFLVNFGSHTVVNPLDHKLNRDQIQNLLNKQFYIDDDNNIVIGLSKYTVDELLTSPVVRNKAKEYIMNNFHYNIDEDGLIKNYLGGNSQSQVRDPHFESVAAFLKNTKADKIVIIPGELEFTLKDFGLVNTDKGKVQDKENPNGISVLGWYIKQGILLTDIADKLYDANIYIDDVQLVNKNDLPNQLEAQSKVLEAVEDGIRNAVFSMPGEDGKQLTLNMADIYQILDGKKRQGPNMEVEGRPITTIDIPSATRWVQDTLGITPEIVQSVVDITETGANVVGRVTEDSILISEIAPEGTEYHEAWHRVSLLCISDKHRKKIYDRYNKKHNTNLNEKELDEIFAELFKEFMLDESSKYNFDTKNWFRRILDFIRLWARTGQYALAKVYHNINLGKYKGLTPNLDNINRFRLLYADAGPNLEVNGYNFKTIATYNQFDNIVKSLAYAFFQTSFTTGKVINYADIKKDDLRFDTLKLIVLALASKFPSPVLTEIVDRFDDVFAPTIASKLKSFGIRSIEMQEDITDIEEGVEGVNIGQHTVEGMNISIKDNAPAEVKFFFLTIPVFEGTVKDANAKIDPYTKFPMFVDPNKAWNNVLKDLAGCRTISNILDKVVMLAKNNDPFYQALLMRLSNLISQSNSTDSKISTNAEALLTKIETVITSDINNYITVKVSEDETGFTSMKLVDNTVDTKAIGYPKVWSQSLFVNSNIFKYNDSGVVVALEGAKQRLKDVIDTLVAARTAFMNNKGIYKVKDFTMDLHQLENQERLKDIIVQSLQSVGILIDKPTINKMLLSGDYGNPKSDSYQLLNSFVVNTVNFGGLSKVTSTLDTVNSAINNKGEVGKILINDKQVLPTLIWNDMGFIKHLANYYAYTHATDKGLSSYGPDGNTYYMVSLNNFVKDRVNEIITDKLTYDDLMGVTYNLNSILLNAIGLGNRNISVETLINFKDNTSYDAGRDYFGITAREDYLAKMTATFEDRIIFPTVADKKTYHFIKGVKLPHEAITFSKSDGRLNIEYGLEAMDILLGYCNDELNQIELCLRQIDDNPEHYRDGVHYNEDGSVNQDWLEPSRRIKNFHTPNKYKYKDKNGKSHTVTLEGNGARFLFLTGIYTNKGFISFNDPKKTAYENLQTAKDYFFNTSRETLVAFLGKIINERMKDELKTAKDMGLIDIDNNKIWSIQNKLLDENVVAERAERYRSFDSTNAEAYAVFDMLSDYLINSIISINEIEKVFSGAPAYYKVKYDENGIVDLSVDKIKRLGSLTSTGTNNRLDFYNDPLREEYTVAELKDHEIQDKQYYIYEGLFMRGNIKETIQEIEGEAAWDKIKDLSIVEIEKIYPESVKIAKQAAKVEVAGYKSGINVADAAVYISPNMTRDLLRMKGEWSDEVKEAFKILTDPETADMWESDPILYAKANKIVLNAMKYMSFGTRFNPEVPGLGIPYFNKMALFPLFKSVATGDIKALYDRMTDENNPLDMVLFDSAVKAGSRNPLKAYRSAKDSEIELRDGQTVLSAELTDQLESGEGNILNDFNNLTTYKLKFKYLRQQLATDPHTHEEAMAGTLFMKVNLSNLRMNDMYGKEGDLVSGQLIKETVMNSLNRLSDLGKLEILDKLFTEDGQVNITALGEMLLRDARESSANDNVITGLATKDNAFTIPLSALSDNKWIESRFISMINKSVIDVHMPGGSFIQRSAFGLEATSNNVITPNMINDGRPLKMINEEGSMDAVVSINLFKHFIPNYSKMTFREARKWLIDHKIIGQEAEANSIGYRIPTQSVASISPLRFVDVFPEIMGDTIMLPEGFTKLTGSDFDIDKLYIARFGYDRNGNKINDGSAASIKNDMLEAYMRVLLTKDNTNSLKLSIDNATENVKNVLKDIESARGVEYVQPFLVYTPTYQEARKEEYTGGKAGIGPFALNNAHHILTQLTKLKMLENEFTSAMDIIDLGRIYDYPTTGVVKGGRILDWLSAMINGFVDIAKDPYIVRLNVNAWTYNMVSFLLRTGKGAQTFYFVGQPILKQIADEVIKTKGKYGIDRTKTPSLLEKEAIDKVLDEYDPTGSIRKKYAMINSKPATAAIEYSNLFKTFIKEDGSESSHNRELLLHPEDYDFREEQIRTYYAWLALKPYADDLANLVKYSKIDTKKTGKTFAEQLTYYQGMMSMIEDSRFGAGEVERFYNETFIARKTENSIPFGNSIFSNLLFRNTYSFSTLKDNVLALLGRKNNADSKLLNAVISGMEALTKSEFFNNYIKDNNIDVMGMFKGNRTIAKRLNKFKMEILSGNPNYSYLLNSDGTINNDFLNYLIPNIDNDNLDFLDTSELLSADLAEANNLINYWRELLDDPKPEIKRLAKDLALYAFLTSGDNPAMNSFFQYLPNSYRKELGYVDYVQGKLDQLSTGSNLATYSKTDLFLNNWTNDKLVKPIDMYHGENNDTFFSVSLNEDSIVPNIIIGQRTNSLKPSIKPINWIKVLDSKYPLFPPYIKINDQLGNKPENWHVYTLVGFKDEMEYNYNTGKTTGRILYSPIYGLVSKKGYKGRSNGSSHTIVEYGVETKFNFNMENEWDYTEALNNLEALVDMTPNYLKDSWKLFINNIHPINELPSYLNMNYAKLELDRIFVEEYEEIDENDDSGILEDVEEPIENSTLLLGELFDSPLIQLENLWSLKEGWSIEYFRRKVLPKIHEAWQLEYKLASNQSVSPDFKGTMNYEYKDQAAIGIVSKTTLDAIINGERTATTRYDSDGHIDYWKKAKVGDVIEFSNKLGTSVKVVVTKPLTKLLPSKQVLEKIDIPKVTAEEVIELENRYNIPEQYRSDGALAVEELPDFSLKPNINNTESTANDPINYNDTELSEKIISSNRTILTNLELLELRPFTGDKPRIAVASEHTDPVFFSKKIIDILDGNASVQDKFRNTSYSGSDFAALYLITKHDGLPLKNLLEYKIPKLIHFSITGLGGTIWEPGVMKYNDLLDRIDSFIKQGLDPEMVTVRIDPIVPGVTKLSDVENIVKRSSEMGIKNIRFSVMDLYSTTKKFMEELGYDYSKYYDKGKLHARPDVIQRIENRMLLLKEKYGVKMSTCAEPFNIAGISKEACLSVSAINNMLGTSIPETMTGKQRALCSCYGGKTDLLRYDNKCASSCIYCYAHHNNNKNLNYYNEDGSLKDNPFTRTTDELVQPNTVNIHAGTDENVELTGEDLLGLYDLGDKRILLVLDELEDLTLEERQTYRNEFARQLTDDKVNNQDKLEEAIRKFICNL